MRAQSFRMRLLFVAVLGVFLVLRFVASTRDADDLTTTAKFMPTDLTSLEEWPLLADFDCPSSICPDMFVRQMSFDGATIQDRYLFERKLGSGFEGEAAIYLDTYTHEHVVIKTFYSQTSPFRNTLPDVAQSAFLEERWPTEIPFMLLFSNQLHHEANRTDHGLAGILDYFVLDDRDSREWQLVTEFYHRGTLSYAGSKLARELKLDEDTTTADLDHMFRGSFEKLLKSLSILHYSGFCHDDIKPANVFISNDSPFTWILGDFGQVRNVHHPYHYSGVWHSQSQWEDCILNDTRRLLKVYLSLLRSFNVDCTKFDEELLQGQQSWARLYWEYMNSPRNSSDARLLSRRMTVHELTENTTAPVPLVQPYWYAPVRLLGSKTMGDRMVVDQELRCSLRNRLTRLADWVMLLG